MNTQTDLHKLVEPLPSLVNLVGTVGSAKLHEALTAARMVNPLVGRVLCITWKEGDGDPGRRPGCRVCCSLARADCSGKPSRALKFFISCSRDTITQGPDAEALFSLFPQTSLH